jgi:hypothetical protein
MSPDRTPGRPGPEPRPFLDADAFDAVTIRVAERGDEPALARLAGRDSTRVPSGRLLVAEIGGELLAAMPVSGGRPIADPFVPTATLVSLLELRAAQLGTRRAGGGLRRVVRGRSLVARRAGRPATT